jgi:hypothetical protein
LSLIDKLTGRVKKTVGEIADDPSLRREGRREERQRVRREDRNGPAAATTRAADNNRFIE